MATLNLMALRSRAADRLARLIDFRISEKVAPVEDHTRRVEDHTRSLDERVTEQEHCTIDHRRRLDALESNLERVRGDLQWTSGEVHRLIPHVAAQEDRIESLRSKLALEPRAEEPKDIAEARSLIEEIQQQHAQIRVRLSGIAMYEDRLRTLEEHASARTAAAE